MSGIVMRFSEAVDRKMALSFYNLGLRVGKSPWKAIAASMVVFCICASGFMSFYTESRTEKLWVPIGTEGQINAQDYRTYFNGVLLNQLALETVADGGNILEKDNLLAAFDVVQDVAEIVVLVDGPDGNAMNYTYPMLVGNAGPPFPVGLLSLWPGGKNQVLPKTQQQIYDDITAALNNPKSRIDRTTIGGLKVNEATNKVVSATTILMIWFVEQNEDTSAAVDAWASEFVELALDGGDFDRDFEEGEEDIDASWTSRIRAYPFASNTFAEVFGAVVMGDGMMLGGAYVIVTAYVALNFATCNAVDNKIALAMLTIQVNIIALGAGFGLSSLFGLFFGPLHTVLPLLALGLGVDNCFVLVNAFTRTDDKLPVEFRSARGLSAAGSSVTVTSATDVVAFAVGSFTSLPALSSFCLYAAITILMLYFFTLTMFQAMIVLDERRRRKGRYDCLCCFSGREPMVDDLSASDSVAKNTSSADGVATKAEPEDNGMASKFLRTMYGPALTSPMGLVVVFLMCAGLLFLGIYGTFQLSVEATANNFIPDDSYAKETLQVFDTAFGSIEDQASLVIKDIDYFASQDQLEAIFNQFNKPKYATQVPFIKQPLFPTWYQTFLASNLALVAASPTNGSAAVAANYTAAGRPINRNVWNDRIAEFAPSQRSTMIMDKQDASKILRSRFAIAHPPIGVFDEATQEFKQDTNLQVQTMDMMYDLSRQVTLNGKAFNAENQVFYAYGRKYDQEWETFKIISKELTQNLLVSVAAVFIITTVLIGHPITAFLVFICVLLTVVELLGVSWAWGLSIDTVAVVNLVISVGLSVDYASHLAHNYMGKEGTRQERVIAALGDIGAPVLNGATSTVLAICLLAGSKSYVFRVIFQQFFAAALLGLFNGLVTLPALLRLFGPQVSHAGIEFDDMIMSEEQREVKSLRLSGAEPKMSL